MVHPKTLEHKRSLATLEVTLLKNALHDDYFKYSSIKSRGPQFSKLPISFSEESTDMLVNTALRRLFPAVVGREARTMSIFKRVLIDEEGPRHWGNDFPLALGHRQSPINIVTSQTVRDPMLLSKPMIYKYDDVTATKIVNGGHGWRVDVNSPSHNLEGGPLNHRYKLVQFHAHWGTNCCSGSEHTIDGVCTAGELHLVHYNIDLYDEPGKAMSGENGLAVIGILLKEGKEHPEFEKICALIDKIKHKGNSVSDVGSFNLKAFFPAQPETYFTYEGSLTTPPCYESVTWIVMRNSIELSKAQFDKFRSMLNHCEGECGPLDGPVIENYRDCQPLEDRVIRCAGCETPTN